MKVPLANKSSCALADRGGTCIIWTFSTMMRSLRACTRGVPTCTLTLRRERRVYCPAASSQLRGRCPPKDSRDAARSLEIWLNALSTALQSGFLGTNPKRDDPPTQSFYKANTIKVRTALQSVFQSSLVRTLNETTPSRPNPKPPTHLKPLQIPYSAASPTPPPLAYPGCVDVPCLDVPCLDKRSVPTECSYVAGPCVMCPQNAVF